MKIAVIGATDTAGSRTTARLGDRGVDLVEVSRSHGVDLRPRPGRVPAGAGRREEVWRAEAPPRG